MTLSDATIPDRIRLARARMGWTQKQLADKVGVHNLTISKWERGKGTHPAVIARLVQALSVRFEWLSLGQGSMTEAEAATAENNEAPASDHARASTSAR